MVGYAVVTVAYAMAAGAGASNRPNVLFVVLDDLRPNLGCYNNRSFMSTPNIDALAREAVVFDRLATGVALRGNITAMSTSYPALECTLDVVD